jgi:hypothetical protein
MNDRTKIRIYIDFQNTDAEGRYVLDRYGTTQDLEKFSVVLKPGLRLTFWSDDADEQGRPDPLIAEGIVEFNRKLHQWVARIDKDAIKHESDVL